MKKSYKNFLHNNYNVDDVRKLIDHLQNGEVTSVDDEVAEEIWQESSDVDAGDREQLYREAKILLNKISPKPKTSIWSRLSKLKVAAVVALVCGSLLLYWYTNTNSSGNAKIVYSEATTGYGQIKKVTLPDGSVITLNSCSKLIYPNQFQKNQRSVELLGEAYMEIAHIENSSFTVKTSKLDIRVLGTVFNVKAYPKDNMSSISVDRGKVQVDMPDMMMRLIAKENIIVNNQTKEVSKIKALKETKSNEWMRGFLVFVNTDIYDVARELERTYNCRVTFSNDTFKNCITGEFERTNLDDALRTISFISGLKYRKEGKTIYLYK